MLCPTIVGTSAKKINQGSSCDEKEKTETPTIKEITHNVHAAKKNSHRVYSNKPTLALISLPTTNTNEIATEHKIANMFPSIPVSLNEL